MLQNNLTSLHVLLQTEKIMILELKINYSYLVEVWNGAKALSDDEAMLLMGSGGGSSLTGDMGSFAMGLMGVGIRLRALKSFNFLYFLHLFLGTGVLTLFLNHCSGGPGGGGG